jgi:RNA polymerase sigma factor (sigma-70 family)
MTCKNKTDSQLVKMVKATADNDAFNEICDRYQNIFYKICQKYVIPLTASGVNPQDIFDEKNYIIFHCINTFKANKKTKLSTWIGNYARYLCLNSINARRFILPTTDEEMQKYVEDSQSVQDYFSVSNNSSVDDCNYIYGILSQLKDCRIKEIFKHRYCEGKKTIWAKVAKKMGISTQTAINLHNKGLNLLKKKIKNRSLIDSSENYLNKSLPNQS